MTSQERYDLALSFWTTAFQYLILVENISRETASQGNVAVIVRPYSKGSPIIAKESEEETRWSDLRIIIPLLFNLLHGIELLVKGFLFLDPAEILAKRHNLSELREKFKRKYPGQEILSRFLDKYTSEGHMPELLRRFLTENSLQVNELYQTLRYPTPDFTTMRVYSSLKYQGEEGIPFFSDLHEDVYSVRLAAVSLGRSLEPRTANHE